MWDLEKWYKWTYLQNRYRVTDVENKLIPRGKWVVRSGINREIGTDKYTLSYIKQITNKDQLHITGSSTQHSVMSCMGKESPKKWIYVWKKKKVKVLVTQSCSTFCDPVKCSLSGFSVHGVLQARVLDWVDIHFPRGPSESRDWIWISWFAGKFITVWATKEVRIYIWI